MAEDSTSKNALNRCVGVDGETESGLEGIEQYAVTRSNFSMCLQLKNESIGELFWENHFPSLRSKLSHILTRDRKLVSKADTWKS